MRPRGSCASRLLAGPLQRQHEAPALEHVPARGHPERPERLRDTLRHLERTGLSDACAEGTVRPATDEELLRVHTPAHLAEIARYGLPPDYYDKLMKQVAALAPAQIHALLQSELRPEREVVVLLGTKAYVQQAFAGAGITDFSLVKSEAK